MTLVEQQREVNYIKARMSYELGLEEFARQEQDTQDNDAQDNDPSVGNGDKKDIKNDNTDENPKGQVVE